MTRVGEAKIDLDVGFGNDMLSLRECIALGKENVGKRSMWTTEIKS